MQFDDITVLPVSIPETNQVGIYGALNYSDFGAASNQIYTGRAPPSEPNIIFGGRTPTQFLPANSSVLFF